MTHTPEFKYETTQPADSDHFSGEIFNAEGNLERQLLGNDMNSSTPLWQNDNPAIRVPARAALALGRFMVPITRALIQILWWAMRALWSMIPSSEHLVDFRLKPMDRWRTPSTYPWIDRHQADRAMADRAI